MISTVLLYLIFFVTLITQLNINVKMFVVFSTGFIFTIPLILQKTIGLENGWIFTLA